MHPEARVVQRTRSESVLATNKVIRNTYILLSMTLLFSAFTAYVSYATHAPNLGFMTLFIYMGLLFACSALRNSALGLVAVFALTGFLGYSLGPLLNQVMQLNNGGQLITAALGLTGAIFLGLSGYALTTRKDFSYLAGFLGVALIVVLAAVIISIFNPMPALHLAISSAMVLIASGLILFETSQIINGGERNYLMATIALYVQIYNLFVSLLHILSVFSGRNN